MSADSWTPESEKKARAFADRMIGTDPGPTQSALRSLTLDIIRQWDASTAEPLRAEVARLTVEVARLKGSLERVEARAVVERLTVAASSRPVDDEALGRLVRGSWKDYLTRLTGLGVGIPTLHAGNGAYPKEWLKGMLDYDELDPTGQEMCRTIGQAVWLAAQKHTDGELTALRAVRDAAAEVLRIVDRDTDAVNRLKQALAACPPSGKEG